MFNAMCLLDTLSKSGVPNQAMAPTAAVLSGIKACHENARPDLEEVLKFGETM